MPKVAALQATAWFALVAFFIIRFQFRPGHGLSCGGLLSAVIVFYCLILQKSWDRRAAPGRHGALPWMLAPAVFIGDISYSLYLIHPSVKSAFLRLFPKLTEISHSQLIPIFVVIMVFIATLLVSLLFYRWIELPAQRFGRFAASRFGVVRLGAETSSSV